jgi:hypothetical protein
MIYRSRILDRQMQETLDKYLIRDTFDLLEDEPLAEAKATEFSLGVIGSSSAKFWNRETITEILNPLISEFDKLPTIMNIPTDGTTSILLQVWAERQGIKCAPIEADWIRLGRSARALRDSRIIKESSHLVFFVGSRSDYYEKMAIREAKKGKTVYTIDGKTRELVQWVL